MSGSEKSAGELEREKYGINPWSGKATGPAGTTPYVYDPKTGNYKPAQ
ncbi:MAG: hypothetical protein AAGE65_11520 [Planctomycetota bacterium]